MPEDWRGRTSKRVSVGEVLYKQAADRQPE